MFSNQLDVLHQIPEFYKVCHLCDRLHSPQTSDPVLIVQFCFNCFIFPPCQLEQIKKSIHWRLPLQLRGLLEIGLLSIAQDYHSACTK